ncbi:NUDIX domain-containing protein [soil metagenome]
MRAAASAGILLYRRSAVGLEVFIAHMGGPFWARKDERAWSIPKGAIESGEDELAAARREFHEEIGVPVPTGELVELGAFRYASGKSVTVFALEAPGFEITELVSNSFELEWPPRSGRMRSFPELSEARWVPVGEAGLKLVAGQAPMLNELQSHLD